MTATLIQLTDASVRFGHVPALRNINLALRRGDRLGLVGANGSGKTTLLRLLNGLIAPSTGLRSCGVGDGAALDAVSSGPAPVTAMLFQRPFLLHLSVRRNLLLALWLARVPAAEREERVEQSLRRVGLQSLAGRAARSLSGGQQQRLALARAWGIRPDILFLDEPTASLDPSARREVEALIDDFAGDGMTLVMSSHNLGQVKRLCTRVIHLDGGRLIVDALTDTFFTDHALPPEALQFLMGELPWA